MLFAANPSIPDAEWLLPVLTLIFAVPIGAFLSLYAIFTSFLFQTVREVLLVAVLSFLAFCVNGCALLLLTFSAYNHGRYMVVPMIAFLIAVAAASVAGYRTVVMLRQERGRWAMMRDTISDFPEDL